MPRTAIPLTDLAPDGYLDGVVWTPADAPNGNRFPNDGATVLLLRNPTAGPITATLHGVAAESGRSADLVVTVAAGAIGYAGPFRQGWWNQYEGADEGQVQVDHSDAGLELAAVRVAGAGYGSPTLFYPEAHGDYLTGFHTVPTGLLVDAGDYFTLAASGSPASLRGDLLVGAR